LVALLGLDLGAATSDANTVQLFRGKVTEAGALDLVFTNFDRQLKKRGQLAIGGPFVDATLAAAPKQRNTAPEKAAIKAGKAAAEIWPDEPARAAQKDTDVRWTLMFAKGAPGGCQAGGRHRHSQLRLQKQHRDLPELWLHSQMQGPRWCPLRWADAARCRHQRQRRLGRLGRHRLTQPGQQGMAQTPKSGQPYSSQEAARRANARAHR
jgi:hypothetical protein